MISARLVHQVGIKAAYATPSTSTLRERAALLGISAGASNVKEQLREDELPDGFAPAVGEEEGFWPDMPDAVDEAEEEAAVEPSQAPQAPSLPLPDGQKLVTLRAAPSSSSSGTPAPTPASGQLGASAKARAPAPQEVKPPNPVVKEELGGKGRGMRVPPPPKREIKTQALGPRNWELERERKRQALSLKDAGCKAICAIKHALRQPGAQADGQAFVPEDWDTAFKPMLGSYIKFLLSRPDQFRVIEGSAPGLFTVENVATTELVKAPAWGSWKKPYKGKSEVKVELKAKSEVKEEFRGGQRSWQPNQHNQAGANRGGAWRQGNNDPQQSGWRPWKTEPGGDRRGGGSALVPGGWRPEPGGAGGDGASQRGGWRSWRPEPGGPHRTEVKVESGSRWSASSTTGWREKGGWASDDRGGKGGGFQGRVKEEPGTWNPRHRTPPPPPLRIAPRLQPPQALPGLQALQGVRPSSRPSMAEEKNTFHGAVFPQHGGGAPRAAERPDGMYGMGEELHEVEPLPFHVDGDESAADRAWAQAEPAGDEDSIDAWGLLSEQMRDHLQNGGDAKRLRQS